MNDEQKIIGDSAGYLENFVSCFGPDEGIGIEQENWARLRQHIINVANAYQNFMRDLVEEYGWLIEDGKGRYLTFDHIGFARWTPNADEAVRFCRRVDAEKVAAGCEDAWQIYQHGWAPMPRNNS